MTEAHHLAILARDLVGDRTSEPAFERIARLAAHLCGASIASVCINSGGRSWLRARIGNEKRKGGSAVGFCSRVKNTSSTLIVHDTHADPQFRQDPAIANVPWVRFYAGAPLNTPDGHCVGTLCVMDTSPRPDFGDAIAEQLEQLAALVVEHLQQRRNEIALARSLAETKLRNRALRGIATDEPLADILDRLVRDIEVLRPGMLGSVLLLDPERHALAAVSAPSLPDFFVGGIDGVAIGPESGPCAAAAFGGEPVVVADLEAQPGWTAYRDLARRAGLAACWSRPIADHRGQVLGIFGFYYREPREPDEDDIAIIDTACSLALIAIERDRSERERLALTTGLERARNAAEASSRAKSEFLAHMSHEFRTPLNAILGFSEMIRDEYFGPHASPQYRGYAEDIRHSGAHLLRLVTDVLDMSRLDAGNLDIRREAVDLPSVIEDCLGTVRDAAAAKELYLSSTVQPDLPPVAGDPTRLRRVFGDLLANAVKYTGPGGRIGIDARRTEGGISVRIADTGIGMTPDEIRIALEPFRQVGTPFDRSQPGTGLGLSLARSLTLLHGGDFRIESMPGTGTAVTVSLPLRSRHEGMAASVGTVAISAAG